MREIFLTGSSGFVGENIVSYFAGQIPIKRYIKGSEIKIHEDIVIHLAGKAHDLKKVTSDTEYYLINTEFCKKVFDAFLSSKAYVFITLSSVKAVADNVDGQLTEDHKPNPVTHYGKSKLLAEQYILSKDIPQGKRVYILRPCMIHGPGNKGNLNLLYSLVKKGLPWPLGSFNNKRSFCSIDNLCFVIKELIERKDIPSGVYNISDNESVSTNQLIKLIAKIQNKKSVILNIPKFIIYIFAKLGDLLHFPLNTERLQKLTESYLVSNNKLLSTLDKDLPVSSKEGLIKTFQSFNH